MKKLVIALVLALPLAGCSGSDAAEEDSGVAQCRKLAATAASPAAKPAGAPTDEEFERVRRAYADSQYSDLKRAGLAHLEAVKAYYTNGGADIQSVLVKRSVLDNTCAAHGVKIVHSEPTYPVR